jgi:hypothetical protein
MPFQVKEAPASTVEVNICQENAQDLELRAENAEEKVT